ncbi:MAG: Na+/H+ antiporter subunit E [Aquificaceae bacterium]|nr:Na+/H+ antiporter subunit E [Aquificaceae bacterium]MDW8237664.1 Na+/H+ antiporter subunit E [Aquificaceae bacterium]
MVKSLILLILWTLLASLEPKSILMGIAATAFTISISKPVIERINALGLLIFLPVFIKEAIVGGLDVLMRIITGEINPGFIKYRVRNRKVIKPLAVFITLTPGTMSVKIEEQEILVHTINLKGANKKSIRRMEILLKRVVS